MASTRFSLRAVFLWVLFSALSCTALKFPSILTVTFSGWATAILTSVAVTIAVLTTGPHRVFWTAFSACMIVTFIGHIPASLAIPPAWTRQLWSVLHEADGWSDDNWHYFHTTVGYITITVVSLVTASTFTGMYSRPGRAAPGTTIDEDSRGPESADGR